MDLKTIMATLAVLGGGSSLAACGDSPEKGAEKADAKPDTKTDAKTEAKADAKPDAKPVPHAKGGEGADAKAGGEGEMSCAPGKCGEGMCGGDKKAGTDEKAGAGDKGLAGQADEAGKAPAAEPAEQAGDDPAT